MCALRRAGRTRSASEARERSSRSADEAAGARARGRAVHEVRRRTCPPNFKFCPSLRHARRRRRRRLRRRDARRSAHGRRAADATPKPGRSTMFFGGAMQAARAKLTLIRGDGEDGVVVHARRHRSPRGSRRLPDLVPRRSVPLADPRELPLRATASSSCATKARSTASTCASAAPSTIEPARRSWSASRCSSVAAAPSRRGSCPTPRARTTPRACCARRRSRSSSSCAAARAAGSIASTRETVVDRPRGQRHQLPRRSVHLGSPRAAAARRRRAIGYRPGLAQRHVRSRHRRARAASTATTSSWASSYFASKSSERPRTGATMTVCNRCGKENQDHYKFCLGCGAELTAPKAGQVVTWR